MSWRKKPIWLILAALITLGSFIWLVLLLKDGFIQIMEQGMSLNTPALALSWILAVAATFITSQIFFNIMQASGARFSSFHEACELNFTAQVMRHLPGRFFGVAYQVVKAKHVANTAEWICGNIAIILLSTWLALVFSSIILIALEKNIALAFMILISTLSAPFIIYGINLLLGHFSSKNQKIEKFIKIFHAVPKALFSAKGRRALAWGTISWCVYAMAWAAFGEALPLESWHDGLILGALYTLAWAIGFFSLITPSGLGVRELAFALLASSYPPEILLFVSVAARLGLMLADFVLGIVFLVTAKREIL